jgi:sphingomyelin phosphodiesterase 2
MRLRLVTLNTWALPWKLSYDVEARMQFIAAAIAELQPDVVTLQELWNRSASRRLIDALRRSGLRHQWTDGLGLGNGGLAFASRYPISHARFTRFRVQGRPERVRHGDYYGGKGFVEAMVDLGGQSVTVVNTHLHSRHVSSAPHLYTAERTAQAVELAVAMKHAASPCVIAGDFNMSPTGQVYEVFRALSGCSDAAVDCGNPSTTHFHRLQDAANAWTMSSSRTADPKGSRSRRAPAPSTRS